MISGVITHSGVLATRPLQDFDLLSVDGCTWYPVQDLISLIPQETERELPREVVQVQIQQGVDHEAIL
jgi:hypothetical protein